MNIYLLFLMKEQLKMLITDGLQYIYFQIYIYLRIFQTQMGQCTQGKQNSKLKNLDAIPEDIQKYDSSDKTQLAAISFEAILSSIKIVQFQLKGRFLLHFIINDILDYKCELKHPYQSNIKWDSSFQFKFDSNNYDIRKKFLAISLCDDRDQVLDEININLYRIITGPFHHDLKMGKKGRVVFDFKISQIVEYQIESTSLSIEFFNQYPGEKFNFVLNYQGQENRKSFETIPSYSEEVPLDIQHTFRTISYEEENPSPTLKLKNKASNLIKAEKSSKINWSIKKFNQMPAIQLKLRVDQNLSSVLGFKLFHFYSGKKLEFFGGNFITLTQMLAFPPQSKKSLDVIKQFRSIKIQKKLWYNGKTIGSCTFNFEMKNQHFIEQSYSSTQTEDGVIKMSSFQMYGNEKRKGQNQLETIYNQIFQRISGNQKKCICRKEFLIDQKKELEKVYDYFVGDLANSYVYNAKKIKKNQQILLKIMRVLMNVIDQSEIYIKDLCWKVAIEIIKRGQFLLKNINFTVEEHNLLRQNKQNSEIKQKKQIGQEYIKMMYNLLSRSLESKIFLNSDNAIQNSEIFKVFCFFRLPIFRQKILSSLIREEDKKHYKRYQKDQQLFSEDLNEIKDYCDIDWESQFFSFFNQEQTIAQANKKLQNFLETCDWFDNIYYQGELFLNFLRNLLSVFNSFRKRYSLPEWQYFPGYNKFVWIFLKLLKNDYSKKYSVALQLAGLSLLQNEKLFSRILKILYQQTNVYQKTSVLKLNRILSAFISLVGKFKGESLNFPYNQFMFGIKRIFQVDCSLSLSYTLILLYNVYNSFSPSFKIELTLYLLGNKFWFFFYHWSKTVRRPFHHILILKICQDMEINENIEVSARIVAIENIINNAKKVRDKKMINQRKMLDKHLHTKIREKFYQKLNQRKKIKKQGAKQFGKEDFTYDYLSVARENTLLIDLKTFEVENKSNRKYKSCKIQVEAFDITKKRLSLAKKLSYHDHLHKYKCFHQEQLILEDMPQEAIKYIICSTFQMGDIIHLLEEYHQKNGTLPDVDLGLHISIDQNEIRPSLLEANFFE